MRLYHSPASPYVRKVLVAAHEVGLIERIEIVSVDVYADDGTYRALNPLCRIPSLVTDEGTVLIDSLVIAIHLDELHDGAKLLPSKAGHAPVAELHNHAVANGVIDAGLNLRGDQRRGIDRPDDVWVKRQYAAMAAGLDVFEADMDRIAGRAGLAAITAGVALSYLDFRFPAFDWRAGRPNLTAWHAAFAARPSMKATEAHD